MKPDKRAVINSFTKNIIDYAGLFPPANLKLNSAVENYLVYKESNEKEMLSRFICPAKLFPELKNLIKSEFADKNLSISVLGKGGENIDLFLNNLKEDLRNWSDFKKTFGKSILTDSFEVKLPDELIHENNSEKISDFIKHISGEIKNETGQSVFIFFECVLNSDWKGIIKKLINGINVHNESQNNSGFKLRTGGVTAESIPDSGVIAFSIKECLDRDVPMKCTAGLHHPFRHFNKEIGTKMHGFINVFGAGIIAMRHNISETELLKILNDENPENFVFTDDFFSWDDYNVNNEEIELARNKLMLSFGSCSFDEPVSDLKDLNLL